MTAPAPVEEETELEPVEEEEQAPELVAPPQGTQKYKIKLTLIPIDDDISPTDDESDLEEVEPVA